MAATLPLAVASLAIGNLAALVQKDVKRILAYQSIAHAGYLMMGVAAAIALAGRDPHAARSAVSAVCFYLGTYVFMNLAAFAIVAQTGNMYNGLWYPIIIAGATFVIGMLFVRETKDVDIYKND